MPLQLTQGRVPHLEWQRVRAHLVQQPLDRRRRRARRAVGGIATPAALSAASPPLALPARSAARRFGAAGAAATRIDGGAAAAAAPSLSSKHPREDTVLPPLLLARARLPDRHPQRHLRHRLRLRLRGLVDGRNGRCPSVAYMGADLRVVREIPRAPWGQVRVAASHDTWVTREAVIRCARSGPGGFARGVVDVILASRLRIASLLEARRQRVLPRSNGHRADQIHGARVAGVAHVHAILADAGIAPAVARRRHLIASISAEARKDLGPRHARVDQRERVRMARQQRIVGVARGHEVVDGRGLSLPFLASVHKALSAASRT